MGTFRTTFVVGIVNEYQTKTSQGKALDNFVKANKNLFTKSKPLVNGFITYVMFYDGSKEGWEESEKADELREEFIRLLDAIQYSEIYYIDRPEDKQATLSFSFGRGIEEVGGN